MKAVGVFVLCIVSQACGSALSDSHLSPKPAERLHFHSRTGSLVKLSDNARTAERLRPLEEYNNGIVMTHRPLRDDELFEIKIDRLVEDWSSSLYVGVTTHNPISLDFPADMSRMSGTILLFGSRYIQINAEFTKSNYGEYNLEELRVGDRIGMMRKSNGNLHFYINGLDQGVAATEVPAVVWGLVDLFASTVKVTIVDRDDQEEQNLITRRNTTLQEHTLNVVGAVENSDEVASLDAGDLSPKPAERLHFHSRTGSLVKLSDNARTAERLRPLEKFNNGVVLTHRPLRDDELFEIKIDRLVEDWYGSLYIGVTTHNPISLDFPADMSRMPGTILMFGQRIRINGEETKSKYGEFNLEELRVGDRIGMMRKSNGNLHFYINGQDQGVAATEVPAVVWGMVDLFANTVKVTVVDRDDQEEHNLITRRNTTLQEHTLNVENLDEVGSLDAGDLSPKPAERLHFHSRTGSLVKLSDNARTAERLRPLEKFDNGVVMTHRPLRDDELFEIKIDRLVESWVRSLGLRIGVTTHNPISLDFPDHIIRMPGTILMFVSSILNNGEVTKNKYGELNLQELRVGDRIGMMKSNGNLHFYINGLDQGVAATEVPAVVWGVVDLYANTVEVTIVDRDDQEEHNLITRRNTTLQEHTLNEVKARELLIEALDHLSQDLNVTKSKIETKLKSLEKAKLYLKQVNPLDLFVNISLNTMDLENEVDGVDVSRSREKKKYSVFEITEEVDWDSANRLCKDKGFELASVESVAEEEELVAAIKSFGVDGGNLLHVWIGGHRVEDDGEFVWSSSGRPLSYTNWVPGDSSESPYNCVFLSKLWSHKWVHYECDNSLNYYACEYFG